MSTIEMIQLAISVIKNGISLYEELAAMGATSLTQNQRNLILAEFDALKPRIDAAVRASEPQETRQDIIDRLRAQELKAAKSDTGD